MHFLFLFLLASTTPQPPPLQQEIVVTASALPETVETTPAAVSVVTREDIEERAAREVSDVLREVPGVAVSRTGSGGKTTSVFIRGGSSKQALVLWNGVALNSPYFSGYNYFGNLSAAGVERVEVVRGPFSALYGSEAVSGVVNVLTTPARSGATIDIAGGEHGLLNLIANGAVVGNTWNAHGTVERRQDDGFAANDDFQSTSYLGGATLRPTAHLSVGVLGRHATYDVGIPRTADASFSEFVPSLRRREEGSETQLAVPVRFDNDRLRVEVRLSDSRRDDNFGDPDGPFGPESSTTKSRSRLARATIGAKSAFGFITVGGEYGSDRVDHSSNFAEIDARERENGSLFIEDRLSFSRPDDRIEITAGVRYDDYDTFGSELTPRVAAAWLRAGHKIRAAYGQGFRAPAIGELYFPFGGNPDLGSESSTNFEIGYDHLASLGTFSATLFRSKYDGLIVFAPSGIFENVQAATARGIELAIARSFGAFDLSASYTHLDTENDATGEELLRRPEHSGSLAVGYARGAYHTELVILHKGARADVTDLFPFGVVQNDSYTTADITVRYMAGPFAPYVKLENVSDEQYEEVFGYPSPGRRAVVGLRYTLR